MNVAPSRVKLLKPESDRYAGRYMKSFHRRSNSCVLIKSVFSCDNKVNQTSLCDAALQSPIEYQKEKSSSSSLTRNRSSSGNRSAAPSHSRPSSAVGLGDKETERGRSQMKVSTSNGGSSCFESRVSSCDVCRWFVGVSVLQQFAAA